jgi:ATP-binding cassette subfamily A (ABC1) protein 3
VLIVQSFFIQVFFTRAKIGVVIALLFFIIQYILSFLTSNSDNPTLGVNSAASIIPHVGLILAF